MSIFSSKFFQASLFFHESISFPSFIGDFMGAALRTSWGGFLGVSWGLHGDSIVVKIGSPPRSHQEAREGNPFMKKILTYLKETISVY